MNVNKIQIEQVKYKCEKIGNAFLQLVINITKIYHHSIGIFRGVNLQEHFPFPSSIQTCPKKYFVCPKRCAMF